MLAVAAAAHAGFTVVLARQPAHEPARPRRIEVDFRTTPAPAPALAPAAAAAPASPPPARRRVAARAHTPPPAEAPPTPVTPLPAAPAASPRPMFGVAIESPTSSSSSGLPVPIGGSVRGAPGGAGRAGAPGGSPGGTGTGGGAPVSAADVKTMPDVDADACGRTITYPADAEQSGVAGDVRLRVALDERGHVLAVRVLSGLGHGLDQAAVEALRHRCRFTPAIDTAGKAVPFVIQSYTFHFELPR